MDSPVVVVVDVNVDILLPAPVARTVTLVVSLSDAGVLGVGELTLLVHTVPSGALDGEVGVGLDGSGVRRLSVPVGGGKDAERDAEESVSETRQD